MKTWLLFIFLFCSFSLSAKQPRILIILDGSSSMLEPWNGGSDRFRAAAGIITRLMDSVYAVNDGVEFALRVYGHQHPAQENNCYDSKLEVIFSKNNLTQMELRLAALVPRGITPVSFSLREAAEFDMVNTDANDYSIVLITDGGESCGGDVCATSLELWKKKIAVRPYVIGLVNSPGLKQQYNCLGDYLPCFAEDDVPAVIDSIVKGYRKMIGLHPRVLQEQRVLVATIDSQIVAAQRKFEKDRINTVAVASSQLPVNMSPVKAKPVSTTPPLITSGSGYVLFINAISLAELRLFAWNGSSYVEVDRYKIEVDDKGRIPLPAGKYKAVLNSTAKEFSVRNEMITEVKVN